MSFRGDDACRLESGVRGDPWMPSGRGFGIWCGGGLGGHQSCFETRGELRVRVERCVFVAAQRWRVVGAAADARHPGGCRVHTLCAGVRVHPTYWAIGVVFI